MQYQLSFSFLIILKHPKYFHLRYKFLKVPRIVSNEETEISTYLIMGKKYIILQCFSNNNEKSVIFFSGSADTEYNADHNERLKRCC